MKYLFYHRGCLDGYGSMYAAWKRFGNACFYQGVDYDEDPKKWLWSIGPNDEVYVADFCFLPKDNERFLSKAKSVVILDHHVTAQPYMVEFQRNHPDRVLSIYDVNRSGASIAWEYFHGVAARPTIIIYVEDRDLWRFQYPESKPVTAYLWSIGPDMLAWDVVVRDPQKALYDGSVLLQQIQSTAQAMARNSFYTYIAGTEVPVVNCPVHRSEIGEELLKQYPHAPFVGVFYDPEKGLRKWSLRSRVDSGVNVAHIAQRYPGGGGHENAAGFTQKEGTIL